VSWILASEILGALPLLGLCSYSIPLELALKACEQGGTPAQWKALTDISDELDRENSPVLLLVEPRWESLSHRSNDVEVECIYDFSNDYDIVGFTEIVAELCQSHGEVRYVYKFG
jgi:hypothetical protein